MISWLNDQPHRVLHHMVIWDAVRLAVNTPDYESAVTLVRRGLAARVGKRGRSGWVWFEPTAAGKAVILRPPDAAEILRHMRRDAPAPDPIIITAQPRRPAPEARPWFDDLHGKEEL